MKVTSFTTLAHAGLIATQLASPAWAQQPPKMKMTTDIPSGIATPDKLETDQQFPSVSSARKTTQQNADGSSTQGN